MAYVSTNLARLGPRSRLDDVVAEIRAEFGLVAAGVLTGGTFTGEVVIEAGGTRRVRLTGNLTDSFIYVGPSDSASLLIRHTPGNSTLLRSQNATLFLSASGLYFDQFAVNPDGSISLRDLGVDPTLPPNASIWNVGGVLRKRSGGVISNL